MSDDKDEWLTDTMIEEYLKKLRKYLIEINREINGLEDPCIIFNRPDKIVKCDVFVRIFLSRNNHWICLVGQCQGKQDFYIYDSLERNEIDECLGNAIKKICPDKKKKKGYFSFKVFDIQMQKRQFCGYFSLAYATSICLGLSPENMIFDEERLRLHYLDIIFHNKPLSLFPYEFNNFKEKKKNKILYFKI
jgi:hypothetical protein